LLLLRGIFYARQFVRGDCENCAGFGFDLKKGIGVSLNDFAFGAVFENDAGAKSDRKFFDVHLISPKDPRTLRVKSLYRMRGRMQAILHDILRAGMKKPLSVSRQGPTNRNGPFLLSRYPPPFLL
jgi:hypothetical protein